MLIYISIYYQLCIFIYISFIFIYNHCITLLPTISICLHIICTSSSATIEFLATDGAADGSHHSAESRKAEVRRRFVQL